MAIIQISKIQQRSGDLVDLPQLDEAEFGFATDAKRLYIGKEDPAENIEVLTSYSNISFSQIEGSIGNLNIDGNTIANGQVLAFDGENWVNKGGEAGGLLTLGNVTDIKIDGGALGYVLETDGTGNLSWTTKGTISGFILNISQDNPGVITTTQDNFFTNKSEITITNVLGMTELNGNTYYANVLTSNSFALYEDSTLTIPVDTIGYGAFPYSTASNSNSVGNVITLADATVFANNNPINFIGDTNFLNSGVLANITYYVKSVVNDTDITISATLLPNGVAGNTLSIGTSTFTNVQAFSPGGRCLSAIGGSTTKAEGATTSIQYNISGVLQGSSNFTYNNTTSVLNLIGTANISDVNISNTTTSPTVVTNTITTGANSIAGTITGNWSLTPGTRLTATYADLAEYYSSDKNYSAGTVLDFGGEHEVTIAGIESNKIAGVVSAEPAYVMNGMIQCEYPVAIALQGRVPCKVKGKVSKGDMMISAGDGFAKATIATPKLGTVIGKALQNFDGEEGIIEVVVGRL